MIGGARAKTHNITCYGQGYKSKARDGATCATQIDGARQKPLYASTTSAFFDISDIFSGIRSRSLAIYPICLSPRDTFFSLRIKFEDTTDWIVERVLRV